MDSSYTRHSGTSLPDFSQQLAADVGLFGLGAFEQPFGGGHDTNTDTILHAGDIRCTYIYAATGLADLLETSDKRFARYVLEGNTDVPVLDSVVGDITFFLQNTRDRCLSWKSGWQHHYDRRIRIPNAGQHVGYRINNSHFNSP